MTSDSEFLSVARRAALRGGEIVASYFRKEVEIRGKQSFELVTDADLKSESEIVATIRNSFPDHAILGEEGTTAALDSEHLWIVDPLDGTNNFAHGIDFFAISIAYYRAGQPMIGVVYRPIPEHWWWAQAGCGAFEDGKRLAVSSSERLDQILIGVGFFYDRGAMMEATLRAIGDLFRQKIHGIRRFGAASLDLCLVASGSFGAFFEYELAPWDFAAGRLIVTEAGGVATDARGLKLPLSRSSILASNGKVHEAAREIIALHHPPDRAAPAA